MAGDKKELRELMKRRRDQIPADERALKSLQIAERLLSGEWYAAWDVILVYSAIRSEVDLAAFCEQARRDGKKLYFPRVEQESMEFYRVDSPGQLVPGSFSVMEPSADCRKEPWAKCERVKAPVLVPGVAFSLAGARIGYGGGYYDRYLAAHPLLVPVGVCFETQLAGDRTDRRNSGETALRGCVEHAEHGTAALQGCMEHPEYGIAAEWKIQEHDRRMEWIVTEQNIYRIVNAKEREDAGIWS